MPKTTTGGKAPTPKLQSPKKPPAVSGSGQSPPPSGSTPVAAAPRPSGSNVPRTLSIVAVLVTIVAGLLGLLPERDRNRMLYSAGLISASETPLPTATPTGTPVPTPTPTATATATATPTITPTPLEGLPAAEGEIVAVVARFAGEYDAQLDAVEALQDAANRLGAVRIIAIGHTIADSAQAKAILEQYQAAMVVYGRTSEGGVTVNYEVVPTGAVFQPGGMQRVAASEVGDFDVYLYRGMDVNYFLGLTLGQLYYFQGDYDRAKAALLLAESALDPNRADELHADAFYLYLGAVYTALEDYDAALAAMNRVVEQNPAFAGAYNNRGNVYFAMGNYERALDDYNRALALDPDFPHALYNRGTVRFVLERYADAIPDLTRALELDSTYTSARINRGLSYLNNGDYEQAIDDFSALIAEQGSVARYYFDRGLAYLSSYKFRTAVDDFSRAIALDPTMAGAYENRAIAYVRLDRYDRAIDDLTRALELEPKASTYVYRGGARAVAGQLEPALEDYTAALVLEPELPSAYRERGFVYYLLGRLDEARADLEAYAGLVDTVDAEIAPVLEELRAGATEEANPTRQPALRR